VQGVIAGASGAQQVSVVVQFSAAAGTPPAGSAAAASTLATLFIAQVAQANSTLYSQPTTHANGGRLCIMQSSGGASSSSGGSAAVNTDDGGSSGGTFGFLYVEYIQDIPLWLIIVAGVGVLPSPHCVVLLEAAQSARSASKPRASDCSFEGTGDVARGMIAQPAPATDRSLVIVLPVRALSLSFFSFLM